MLPGSTQGQADYERSGIAVVTFRNYDYVR